MTEPENRDDEQEPRRLSDDELEEDTFGRLDSDDE